MHDSTLYLVKVIVFDWEKAAEMIREYHPTKVTAGLHTDRTLFYTIYENGKTYNPDTAMLFSEVAVPVIEITNDGGKFISPCYKLCLPDYIPQAVNIWTEEAKKILEKEVDIA